MPPRLTIVPPPGTSVPPTDPPADLATPEVQSEPSEKRASRLALLFRDLWINGVAAWPVWPGSVRRLFYRLYGMDVESVGVSPGCFFGSRRVRIGTGTTVNYDCFFDSLATIEIGRNCAIGMQVLFCTSSHELGPPSRRAGPPRGTPIRVGDGCWIGARAMVLPGVTIEDGCVIAAGAVVVKPCDANGLYAGIPAVRIKNLPARAA